MLIEHRFVSPLPEEEVHARLVEFLRARGFDIVEEPDCWLFARGGAKRAKYRLAVDQQPQSARLDYDRGRVSVALALREFTGVLRSRGDRKTEAFGHEYLMTLARGLEEKVEHGAATEAQHALKELATQIMKAHRRRRMIRRLLIYLLPILIVVLIVVIALSVDL